MYNNLQIGYGQSPSLQPQVIAGTTSEGEEEGPSIPNVRLSFITAADQTKFEQLYIHGCAGGKYLTGEGAKEILLKSKLDATTLAQIWFNNYLTFPEFALSMFLTNLKLKGNELPSKIADNISNEIMGVIEQIKAIERFQNNAMIPSMMPFTQRMLPQQNPQQQYSTTGIAMGFTRSGIFNRQVIKCDKAREIFSQAGLPQSDLMQIWNLSDPNNNGKLNQDEFAVAMHLIYRKLNGYDIPSTLPPELIPPSTRELSESVNMIKNMLKSDAYNSSIGLGTYTSGANYAKSRSFTSTPTIGVNDAVVYKHKDEDVGYVSSSRHRIPTVSRSQSSTSYSLSRSSST
ncbi:13829_t:CDS:2, partial [Funneliformis caledonium]